MKAGASLERKIYAVHDRDLKQFLIELNLLDKVAAGEIKCPNCDCAVTIENIGFINMSKGKVEICCDNIACFYKAKTEIRKDKAFQSQSQVKETSEGQVAESSPDLGKVKTDGP